MTHPGARLPAVLLGVAALFALAGVAGAGDVMLAVARSAHYASELSRCEASASTPGFCSGEVTRAAVPLVLGAVQALLSVLALTTAVLVAGRRAAGGALGWVAGAGTLPLRLLLAASLWSEAGRDSLYREDPPWQVTGGAAATATLGALATALGVLVLVLPRSRRALPTSSSTVPAGVRRPWPRALVAAGLLAGGAVPAAAVAPAALVALLLGVRSADPYGSEARDRATAGGFGVVTVVLVLLAVVPVVLVLLRSRAARRIAVAVGLPVLGLLWLSVSFHLAALAGLADDETATVDRVGWGTAALGTVLTAGLLTAALAALVLPSVSAYLRPPDRVDPYSLLLPAVPSEEALVRRGTRGPAAP